MKYSPVAEHSADDNSAIVWPTIVTDCSSETIFHYFHSSTVWSFPIDKVNLYIYITLLAFYKTRFLNKHVVRKWNLPIPKAFTISNVIGFGNIIFVSDIWDVILLYLNSWHMRGSCFCSLVCTSYHNHFRQHHLYNPLSHHRPAEESGIYHCHNGILFLCILE